MLFEFHTDLTRIVSPWDFKMTAIALWTQAGTRCNLGRAVIIFCEMRTARIPSYSGQYRTGWSCVENFHHTILTLNLLDTNPLQTWLIKHYVNPSGLSSHLSAPSGTTVSLRPVCLETCVCVCVCVCVHVCGGVRVCLKYQSITISYNMPSLIEWCHTELRRRWNVALYYALGT